MSRFVNLSIVMISMIFILHLFGIGTGAETLLERFGIGDGQTMSNSNFVLAMMGLYAFAAGAGIIMGFFTRASFEWAIIAGSSATLFVLYGTFDHLISTVSSTAEWVSTPLWLFFVVLSLVYTWSAFEFTFNR